MLKPTIVAAPTPKEQTATPRHIQVARRPDQQSALIVSYKTEPESATPARAVCVLPFNDITNYPEQKVEEQQGREGHWIAGIEPPRLAPQRRVDA